MKENIGSILRENRERKNLLLRQVAARLEIDPAILSKIERNERKATKEQIKGFSKYFDLDYDNLLVIWNSERVLNMLEGEKNLKEIFNNLLESIK